MLGIWLFCRSKTTTYFDAEIASFGSPLELYTYKHYFVSVFDKRKCQLYEISAFPLDKIWYFCVNKNNNKNESDV